MSHTWIVSDNRLSIVSESGEIIAHAKNNTDAKLIAAAPDILDLIEGDLEFLKDELKERLEFSDIETDAKTHSIHNRIKDLQSAINKAKGI